MSFTVYRSSAGSGKTFTLVLEYLKIVLSGPERFRNILAITFTNKAANEMRERILSSLRELASPQDHPGAGSVKHMMPALVDHTGMEQEELSRRAAQVLKMILHNYQDFSVGTIDSFIHRIIKSFAFDLHLPLNFEVELDDQSMVSMAVDLLMSRVGIDETTTDILKKYTESRISDELNWDIEKDLKQFSKRLLKDDIVEYLPALKRLDPAKLLHISTRLNKDIRAFEGGLSDRAAELMALWKANGIVEQDLFQAGKGIYAYVRRLANHDYSKLALNSYVEKTLGEDKWCSGKADDHTRNRIEGLKSQMLSLMGGLVSMLEEEQGRYILYKLLKQNIFPIAVLNAIEEVLAQVREADGIIHISEFDKRIATVVNNESVPFIYERLGERYQHFLIDEFQDTSVLEWQNILPLVENALATAQFNMIVGDGKQAIYRFKGGEVEQLVKLPEIYKKPGGPEMDAREMQLQRAYDPQLLRYNFRSREEIIRFNNSFYSYISEKLPPLIQAIYTGGEQKMPAPNPGGEVRLNFIDASGRKEEWEILYFEKILGQLEELVAQGPYSYSDIAVLCRSNDSASRIAGELLTRGISVISAESLLLSSSPLVVFLVFCLDYVANSEDMLALAGMMSFLASRHQDADMHALLQLCRPEKDAPAFEKAAEGFRLFLEKADIRFEPEILKQMGLYERVEALVRIFLGGTRPDPYVVFFLDVVFEYGRNSRLQPEDFTSWWRENSHRYSLVVPEGLDAVNVMTIHKAKGLEFPVVIYPFANSSIRIANEQKWVALHEEDFPELGVALLSMSQELQQTDYADVYEEEYEKALLDMLNIMYVATTRPTEKLFVMCNKPSAKGGELKSIPLLLKEWLSHEEQWDDGTEEYIFGEGHAREQKTNKPEQPLLQKEFISNDWRSSIVLSGHAANYWDLDDEAHNLEWGKLVHAILARIDSAGDMDRVIREEVSRGSITQNEEPAIRELLQNIIGKEEMKPFFDGHYEVKNEAAIMLPGGREYRPDRIMLDGGRAIVLDYKTGTELPEHHEQVRNYAGLLSDMGYAPVEKYLLYIGTQARLVRV